MRDQGGGSPQLEQDINRLEKIVEILTQDKFCYEAQILRVWSQTQICFICLLMWIFFDQNLGLYDLFLVFSLLYHRMDVEHLRVCSSMQYAPYLFSFYNPLLFKLSMTAANFLLFFYLYFTTIGKCTYLVLFLVHHFFSTVLNISYLRGGFVPVPCFVHDYSWRCQYTPCGLFLKIFFSLRSLVYRSPSGISQSLLLWSAFIIFSFDCFCLKLCDLLIVYLLSGWCIPSTSIIFLQIDDTVVSRPSWWIQDAFAITVPQEIFLHSRAFSWWRNGFTCSDL